MSLEAPNGTEPLKKKSTEESGPDARTVNEASSNAPAEIEQGQPVSSEKPPETLKYVPTSKGLTFLNADGSEHVFSSPEMESKLRKAAARHITTEMQTPGMPELERELPDPSVDAPRAAASEPVPTPAPAPQEVPKGPVEIVDVKINPSDGRIWYRNPGGDVVILDETGDQEYNRQQMEPDTDPATGYPKFKKSIAMEAIPDPTQQQEPAPADAALPQQAATGQENQNPTGPRIRAVDEPDLRDDIDVHRDQFAEDHRGAPPSGGERGGESAGPEALVTPRTPQETAPNGPAIPSFYRRRDEVAILSSPNAPKDAPTLDVILQDPKKAELMGEFMKVRGRDDLIIKYHRDPASMSVSDVESLRALRLEFGTRMALAEEAAAYLQEDDVAAMLKNPKFGLFAESLAPERAMHVIKERGIPLLFMRERNATLNNMILSQRALQGIRSGPRQKYYASLRERVVRRIGSAAKPEHLDPAVMQHVLRKNMFEWLTLRGPTGKHTDTLNSINHNITSVSNILAASVSSDKEMIRLAARQAETGQEMPSLGGVEGSFGQMDARMSSYRLQTEKRAFEGFKQRLHERGVDTNNLSPEDEQSYLGAFEDEREQFHGRGERRRGWFSTILDAFFSSFFTQNRSQFKFKEA